MAKKTLNPSDALRKKEKQKQAKKVRLFHVTKSRSYSPVNLIEQGKAEAKQGIKGCWPRYQKTRRADKPAG